MTGDEFLKLASHLFVQTRTPNEALLRTVISRAYYAAYHVALDFLVDLELPETSDHGVPPQWLESSGHADAIAAGRHLRDLYSARRKEDYDLKNPRSIRIVQNMDFVRDQIERASDIKVLLDRCRAEPARSQVAQTIQAHRQRH